MAREIKTQSYVDLDELVRLRQRDEKLTRLGVPEDIEDWTEDDWRDLHEATEQAIKRIAERHKKP